MTRACVHRSLGRVANRQPKNNKKQNNNNNNNTPRAHPHLPVLVFSPCSLVTPPSDGMDPKTTRLPPTVALNFEQVAGTKHEDGRAHRDHHLARPRRLDRAR